MKFRLSDSFLVSGFADLYTPMLRAIVHVLELVGIRRTHSVPLAKTIAVLEKRTPKNGRWLINGGLLFS